MPWETQVVRGFLHQEYSPNGEIQLIMSVAALAAAMVASRSNNNNNDSNLVAASEP